MGQFFATSSTSDVLLGGAIGERLSALLSPKLKTCKQGKFNLQLYWSIAYKLTIYIILTIGNNIIINSHMLDEAVKEEIHLIMEYPKDVAIGSVLITIITIIYLEFILIFHLARWHHRAPIEWFFIATKPTRKWKCWKSTLNMIIEMV